jgi:AraC-like DNA-binding protein
VDKNFNANKNLFKAEIAQKEGILNMPALHYHNEYEIYYLEKGERNYIINDKYFKITQGDFVLISPFELHKTAGGGFKRILLNFTLDYLLEYYTDKTTDKLLGCFKNKLIRPSREQLPYLKTLLEKLLEADKTNDNSSFIYLGELLIKLGECAREGEDKLASAPDHQRVSQITQYINDYYKDLGNISQIARHFYVSKYHLCRLFKQATGVTIVEYLNNIRIKNACCMLVETKKSITEISFECGFKSSNYFSNIFKKHTKMTPSMYRKFNKK